MPDVDASTTTYLQGYLSAFSWSPFAYLHGKSTATPGTTPAYLAAQTAASNSTSAFVASASDSRSTYTPAFIQGIIRATVSVYTEGTGNDPEDPNMVQYAYIILETDDGGATISEQFRVVAEDYDDGTLSKSQDVKKTIGGGIDASVGEVYLSWRPTIRVSHTENAVGFGNLSDLQALYSLNDPGGTPSNVISFTDHHGQTRNVLMLGDFQKQVLGVMIEGEHAHFLVRLELQEVK